MNTLIRGTIFRCYYVASPADADGDPLLPDDAETVEVPAGSYATVEATIRSVGEKIDALCEQ